MKKKNRNKNAVVTIEIYVCNKITHHQSTNTKLTRHQLMFCYQRNISTPLAVTQPVPKQQLTPNLLPHSFTAFHMISHIKE